MKNQNSGQQSGTPSLPPTSPSAPPSRWARLATCLGVVAAAASIAGFGTALGNHDGGPTSITARTNHTTPDLQNDLKKGSVGGPSIGTYNHRGSNGISGSPNTGM